MSTRFQLDQTVKRGMLSAYPSYATHRQVRDLPEDPIFDQLSAVPLVNLSERQWSFEVCTLAADEPLCLHILLLKKYFEIKGEIKGAVLELFIGQFHCRSISETAAFARKPDRLR